MYRKIREIFENTNNLKEYDPFRTKKEEAFLTSQELMTYTGQFLLELLNEKTDNYCIKSEFINMLKLNLWGNKCDTSITNGVVSTKDLNQIATVNVLESNILCDHSEKIWESISRDSASDIIDIVLDNSGYELFTDLCLSDFIISNKLAKKIRFYVKVVPWFISDVMLHDFHWLISELRNSYNKPLNNLGIRWQTYVNNKIWTVEEHNFWTLPVGFVHMERVEPALYKKLSEAKVIIFKGDLNYRKLLNEINWEPTTPFEVAIGDFKPSKIATLRTLKADLVAGLNQGIAEKTEEKDEKWLISGDFGVIQFADLN